MRSSLVILLVTGCSVSPDLSNLPCPCAEGFVCQADRCVESPDSSLADAGPSDAGADADDSSRDAPDPRDAPQSDGGLLEFLVEEEGGTGINFDWFADKLRIDAPGNGTFESAAIDAGRVVTWTSFAWEPLAAYGRAFSRVADPPYEDGRVDGSGLSLLLPFERAWGPLSEGDEYPDDSAAGRTGHVFGTGATSIPDGVFGAALRLTDTSRVEISMSSGLMPATGEISWSFWARSSQACDANNRVFLGSETEGGPNRSHIWVGCNDGGGSCRRGSVGGVWSSDLAGDPNTRMCGATQVNDGVWHHIVVRKSGSHTSSTLELFMDGTSVFDDNIDYTANFRFNDTHNLWFGNFLTGYPTSVDLDAAVFFNRALDNDEIVQLHQRGRQSLGFEIRVCDEPTCVGVAYQNLEGVVGGEPTGDDGSSDTLPLAAELEGLTGRYAQVRITLSSSIDETPEVRFMRLFAQ